MNKLIVDCTTGKTTSVPLTAEEVAQRDAEATAYATAEAVKARGFSFARAIHLNLSGADSAAKFQRGLTLRRLSGGLVAAFVNNLAASDSLSSGRVAAAQADWRSIKEHPVIGLTGSAAERLTLTETDAVEAAAATFGVRLV